ncbi:myosin light chain kinase 2, skeletal/cardiac muscle isoform X2 [Denticeps clupeoides]|uniref:Protein kinase domain-containing protein n=1 Tax=Denticeps clupeoides TaxID=299321 RepID=A0AAY4AIT8_9TELE|nr:myosin light chain kinase 2, skeletal/cardiac muscle-like isoform X2 [Denticeps clupeoides]
MGGKEKKALSITKVANDSDKKPAHNHQGSEVISPRKSKGCDAKTPPAKVARLKVIYQSSDGLGMGKQAFIHNLERVETLRCFWELKYTELQYKGKEGKEKPHLSLKDLKAQKKKKPPDSADCISLKKQALLFEEVQKLNRENAEHSASIESSIVEAAVSEEIPPVPTANQSLMDKSFWILDGRKGPAAEPKKAPEKERETEVVFNEPEVEEREESEETETSNEEDIAIEMKTEASEVTEEEKELAIGKAEVAATGSPSMLDDAETEPETSSVNVFCEITQDSSSQSSGNAPLEQTEECSTISDRRVTEEDSETEEHKKSRVEEAEGEDVENGPQENEDMCAIFKADGVEFKINFGDLKEKEDEDADDTDEPVYIIDSSPPPSAPFSHRIVSAKPNQISNFYTINRQEILGGGRFGQVHKCMENSSGLTLAAKIIKARTPKEKEMVKNEIQVMNQLDHANLIQLYAAYESRNDIILVLEYVDGGELFDRIIDENYTLRELDTVLFIRQICEGLRHMHKMYILHLDLKPENILCISRATNKIKIIDFGLARKYQPREKLRINFGTPEFLAPEVINYDFVSFNTDMWSLGVITYMLLSGLSPFLGDDDNETLNNILACQWNFEEEEFTDISNEAKDFISKLLIYNKSWRIGAAEALRHPWLSDPCLHHRLREKKNMCRSRRNSCLPPTQSLS